MPIEYLMLAGAVGVFVVVLVVQASAGVLQHGLPAAAGNRDGLAPPNAFCARARRCLDNHIEGLVMFAPLILMAATADRLGPMTALGAQLFLGGRAAHAALYLIGVPWLRTLAWAVGFTGTAIVALALFGIV